MFDLLIFRQRLMHTIPYTFESKSQQKEEEESDKKKLRLTYAFPVNFQCFTRIC